MRRMLVVWSLALASLGLATARAECSVPPESSAPTLVTVFLERGDTLEAISVEPAPYQMVRITSAAGGYRYLPSNRIRSIRDGEGVDRTRDVLERRRTVGTPPRRSEPEAPRAVVRHPVGPMSVTRSYLVTESALLGRIASGNVPYGSHRWYLGFDLGTEDNVSARTAIGSSFFIGSGNDYAMLGARARVRRWLSETSSLVIAPGLIVAQDEEGTTHGRPPGFSGQVSYHPGPHTAVTAEVYSIRKSSYPRDRRETGFMVGLQFGGGPGIGLGVAASIVAMGQFLSHEHQVVYAPYF
ncbi:MAG: hypothetical protein ACM3JJ_05835 [Hyphomicrobiales bacterium]